MDKKIESNTNIEPLHCIPDTNKRKKKKRKKIEAKFKKLA